MEITGLPYVCRLCGTVTTIYVLVRRTERGERYIDAHGARIASADCEDCDRERVHVLDVAEADAAHDSTPIERSQFEGSA